MNRNGSRISVLVATAERSGLLAECLRSLAGSSFGDAEVLVLDQSREPAGLPEAIRSGSHIAFRHFLCPRRGKSAALNLGVSEARGEILAFTDDDCLVAPDWLETIDRAMRASGESCALTGRVVPGRAEGGSVRAPSLREDGVGRTYRRPGFRDVLFGNNMALPARHLERVGRFDEHLGPGTPLPAAEDNDLGYRILRAGLPIRYLPSMQVVHRSWRAPEEQAGLFLRYGVGQGAFYAKHFRRGDYWMALRLARSLFDATRDFTGAALLGRIVDVRQSRAFARGLVRGFVQGARNGDSTPTSSWRTGGEA